MDLAASAIQHPVLAALAGGTFGWALTAAGAAAVFFRKEFAPRTLAVTYGAAAGIMLAAAFWSLLAPAAELARAFPGGAWIPVVGGFLAGGLVMHASRRWLPRGPGTSKRARMLVLAITLHNVPEGLAVGVTFGALALGQGTFAGAAALAIGIAVQNVPEGLSVALPLRSGGLSAGRAFLHGQASALVEPVAAVVGAATVLASGALLPWALAFAAGAMVYVVVHELVPASTLDAVHDGSAVYATLAGFALMTLLDVACG